MSSGDVSSSDGIESNKSDSSSVDKVCPELSSQRLSPVPSCMSMKSNQSMDPPGTFRNHSSDDRYSTNPRTELISGQKRRCHKSRSRYVCVCNETCSSRTPKYTHLCFYSGGTITPFCSRQNDPQIHSAASEQDVTKPEVDSAQRGARSSGLFWMLSLLFGLLCISGAVSYFAGSSLVVQEVKPHPELRLMLAGRSGAGKSASGNTIVGMPVFEEGFSFSPVTKACETHSAVILGRKVKITDTPALSDGSFANCYSNESAIHAFLLVIRLGRMTQDERDDIRLFTEKMGSGALKHTLLLFTGGDLLGKKSLPELLQDSPPVLKEIIGMCGGGYHVFSNKHRTDSKQIKELLLKVESVMYSSGVYNLEATQENIPEHTETSNIVFITCVVLLTLELIRFISPFALVSKLYASKTQTVNSDSDLPQTKPEEMDEVQEVCLTDEMKLKKDMNELGQEDGTSAKDLLSARAAQLRNNFYWGDACAYDDDYDYD